MGEENALVREELSKLLNDKRQQLQHLGSQVATLDADLKALERVLLLFPNGVKSLSIRDSWASANQISELRDMTLMDILKTLAKKRDGLVHYAMATNFIFDNKLSAAKRANLASHIYMLLKNSASWEKVAPGTFKLVDGTQPKLIES
ncbi:MAG: hypothetical protein KJ624_00980 [Chloroflexi bacterium]|nr:hypothetical protein [Chloroflexota bacterium]